MRHVTLMCPLAAALLGAFAQDGSKAVARKVQPEPALPDNAIKIVKVLVNGVAIMPGRQA